MASLHMLNLLDHRKREVMIARCIRALRKKRWQNAAIASTGISGNIIAPSVAAALNMPLIIVRKQGEVFHGARVVESLLPNHENPPLDYVIIDDLIATGDTVRRLDKFVVAAFPRADLKLVVIYNDKFMHGDHFDVNGKLTPVISVSE